MNPEYDEAILARYLDEEGRVTRLPGKRSQAHLPHLYAYFAARFEAGRTYTEREVNELLNRYHTFEDPATLRRELFDRGFLGREKNGSAYWLVERASVQE